MRIGIRAHDVGCGDFREVIRKTREYGFDCIQLVLQKAITGDDGFLNNEKVRRYKTILDEEDMELAMLGAYFNPVHSNPGKTALAMDRFINHLDYASLLGCRYVGTETGSYNDDKWTYHEQNRTDKAYDEVLKIFKRLCDHASKTGAEVAIEGAFNHVIHSPERLKKLIDDLNADHVKVIIDLYNYLDITNYQKRYDILDEAIRLLKDRIVIFHLKDFIVENDALKQVGLGKGLMDWERIIPIIHQQCPEADLIMEGITGKDIPESLESIKKIVSRCKYGSKQNRH